MYLINLLKTSGMRPHDIVSHVLSMMKVTLRRKQKPCVKLSHENARMSRLPFFLIAFDYFRRIVRLPGCRANKDLFLEDWLINNKVDFTNPVYLFHPGDFVSAAAKINEPWCQEYREHQTFPQKTDGKKSNQSKREETF